MKSSLAVVFIFFATIFCTSSLWATGYNPSSVSANTVFIALQIDFTNSQSNESKQLQEPIQALKVNIPTLELQLTRTDLFNEKSAAIGSTITININLPQMAAHKDNKRHNVYPSLNSNLNLTTYSIADIQNSTSNLSVNNNFQIQELNDKTPYQNMLSLQSNDLFNDLYNKPQQMMF